MTKSHVLAFLIVTAISTGAFASGYSKPTWGGARAIGLGGAFVGVADDATAIWHNASGLSFIADDKEHLLYVGMDATHVTRLDFKPVGTPVEKGKNSFYPVPTLGYVNKSIKNLSLGIGGVFTYASGGNFEKPSANPLFNADEGTLYSMELMAAAAYKINDYWSLSAAFRMVRNSLELKGLTALLSTAPLITERANEISATGWAQGASFGTTVKPYEWLQMGLHYRTKLRFDMSGDAQFATLGNSSINIDQTFPSIWTLGFSAKLDPKFMVAFQYDYELNGQVDQINASTPAGPLPPIAQNFQDTHTMHFGGEYKPSNKFSLLAGYARDFNRAIPDPVINRVFGDVRANEYSFGLEYQFVKSLRGALTYHLREGVRSVPNNGTNPAPSITSGLISTFAVGVNYTM
jgi:long-chain fatty acid transport protein